MQGQLEPSCCLLHITHLAPETSQGTWTVQDRGAHRAGLLLWEQTQAHLLPPPQRGAENCPGQAGLTTGEEGYTPRLSRPEVTCAQGRSKLPENPANTCLLISREVREKG